MLVYFELRHYPIRDKRTISTAGNTFSAIATQVKVLERATHRHPSSYKSLLLKGPMSLPQSPTKKQDQLNAVKAFHPGKIASFCPSRPILTLCSPAHASSSSLGKASSPATDASAVAIPSKQEGKKRAVDEEGDVTATDDESPPDKPSKKKRASTIRRSANRPLAGSRYTLSLA